MSTTDPHEGHAHADPEMSAGHAGPATGAGPKAIDPVCGMTVTLTPDTRTESFGGKDFHFCCEK